MENVKSVEVKNTPHLAIFETIAGFTEKYEML